MTLRQYLITMAVATALSWISWGQVIAHIDPFYASAGGFFFFYMSLFLSLLGTLALLIFGVRWWTVSQPQPLFRIVQRSFHEACIVSAFAIILLSLRGAALLRVWNFIAFIFAVVVFILFQWNTRRIPVASQITDVQKTV